MKLLHKILMFICVLTFLCLHSFDIQAQKAKPRPKRLSIMSKEEVSRIFHKSIIENYNITYPIRTAYKSIDKEGLSYILLTEANDSITSTHDTLHYKLNAMRYLVKRDAMIKKWDISNQQIEHIYHDGNEHTIWFWNEYCSFADLDGDQLVDPLIVYGTAGENGTDNGRLMLMLFYKNQQVAIRHQNSVLDFERKIEVDETFYKLPLKVQQVVIKRLEKMVKDQKTILPTDWQKAMQLKKLTIKGN